MFHMNVTFGRNTLLRPLEGAPKGALIFDKIAKSGKNGPKVHVFYAKRGTGFKKSIPLLVVAVLTNISYSHY